MTKQIYHVQGGGDRSVGIADVDATITIEDNYKETDELCIRHIKEFLSEYYDVDIKHVSTEKEYNDYLEAENKAFQEVSQKSRICSCLICPHCGAHELKNCEESDPNKWIWQIRAFRVDDCSECRVCNGWFDTKGNWVANKVKTNESG